MAPGSRPVDSAARGLWLRKIRRSCHELGAPTAASGEAPVGPPGCEPGRRAVLPIQAAWRRRDRATGVPLTSDPLVENNDQDAGDLPCRHDVEIVFGFFFRSL